ncbi:hypothetical protein BAMA_02105 [Bacillus manliponensis]|uniref:Uncharacterized protein n=1 Tax=Bacillus manliponensis TaxID=574376 RepID=A0A073JXB3_9BACI|nr:hypothetical protein [Bacillus manliponensis]KEK18891.1 hypothetical protein BAMA_02105 [Bacillus manliponensis]
MWGKLEQAVLWIISYIPVLLIALYRHVFEKKVSEAGYIRFCGYQISDYFIHIIVVISLMCLSVCLYLWAPKIMFKKLERKLMLKEKGQNVTVKKFERPSLNDYTFFLLTLILPLITVDFSSIVSFLVCFSVITFIIVLLIQIDYLIACPLFFVSSYKVWKVALLEKSERDEEYIIEGYVITKENDFFDKEHRIVKLIRNVYFLI